MAIASHCHSNVKELVKSIEAFIPLYVHIHDVSFQYSTKLSSPNQGIKNLREERVPIAMTAMREYRAAINVQGGLLYLLLL